METITQTAQAQQVLDKVKETYGFVPNLYTEFATHSPAVADVYLTAMKLIGEASLSPKEQQAGHPGHLVLQRLRLLQGSPRNRGWHGGLAEGRDRGHHDRRVAG